MPTGKLAPIETSSLLDMEKSLRIISGRNGARILGGTAAFENLQVDSITIREDATAFTTLTCTDGVATLGATFFLGGASGFLKGDMLVGPKGYRFITIELSGGSVGVTGADVTGS